MLRVEIRLSLLGVLTLALLSGCGKHDVKGKAFIVTKGMTNIHLGLVEVKFFFADLVTASIQKSKNALGARVADLRTGIEKNDQAITVEIRSFVIGPLVFPSKAPSGQPQSEFSRLSAELDEQKRQLDNIVSPQSLVANFPLPVAIGKTDGDGRFAGRRHCHSSTAESGRMQCPSINWGR